MRVSNTVECEFVWVRVPPSAPETHQSTFVRLTRAGRFGYSSSVAPELACIACMVDPATTSMVVPIAQASLIAVPFFFRSRIAGAIKRAAGRDEDPESADGEENGDTPADDRADGPEPPGALRP